MTMPTDEEWIFARLDHASASRPPRQDHYRACLDEGTYHREVLVSILIVE